MIRFRQATGTDLKIISSWIGSAEECRLWAGEKMPYPVDFDKLPEIIGLFLNDSRTLFVDRETAGFGQLVRRSGNRLHLARVIISPNNRGKGLGRRLVEHLLKRAISQEPAKISLNVARDNPVAIRLYERLGFIKADLPLDEPPASYFYMEHVPGSALDLCR